MCDSLVFGNFITTSCDSEFSSDGLDPFYNIILIFILLLAGLPQGNNLIASFMPKFIKGDIVITIIKSLMLFLIYYIVSRFIL